LKPSTGATVRDHRNAVRDRSESLSAIDRNHCPQSPESAGGAGESKIEAALTFYFDRNFGKRFPELIRQGRPPFSVEYHHDPKDKFKFKDTTPDDEWLAKVGAERWTVFSHDRKFHEDLPAVAAIKQHSIGCFYIWGAEVPLWDKLGCFMRGYNMILNATKQTPKPLSTI
jgi:hypothetical protein